MFTPLELSTDFQSCLDRLEKGRENLFVTGRAGTGKSTLLQLFRSTSHRKMVVLAPTGIAALNVQGQTIHSFFGFPPNLTSPSQIRERKDKRLYKQLEILVIDEISMVRADMMDYIDYFLRLHRNSTIPFGGVQIVFFGDLFQLPPVVSTAEESNYFRTRYQTPYFFSADVMQELPIEMYELQTVYRQEEKVFLDILDAIRRNQMDYDIMEGLQERVLPNFEAPEGYITLSPRNATVDSINQTKLASLQTPEFTFLAEVKGGFEAKQAPAEPVMKLKLGAQVMFVRNDTTKKFVNGTLGVITALDNEGIKVKIFEGDGEIIEVAKASWEIHKYKLADDDPNKLTTEVVGSFTQYPLKLAWALTIHKAQGKTFDRVVIDLGKGSFEHGQTYVALSRCRTLEGVVLKQPLKPRDIMVDERIVEFYEQNYR